MLKRCLTLVICVVALFVAPAPIAFAEGVTCPDGHFYNSFAMSCFIAVSAPGTAPQAGQPEVVDQGGTVSACVDRSLGREETISCESERGYWSNGLNCYVMLADPQPPKTSPLWQGREDGAIYECSLQPGEMGPSVPFWSDVMPAGPAAPVDPAVVAQTIVEQMELRAITIGMVPEDRPDSIGVVGLPTWLWVEAPSEQTFGPMTRSASLGGVTVTATAKVAKVLWEMGDGNAVTCRTAGTPFTDGHGGEESPDCGYTYSSQGVYTVRATSFWSVDWTSTSGPSGSIPLQFTQSRIAQIGELQVVRTG